jgi:MFS family permease
LAFYSSTFLRDFNTSLTDQDAERESTRALWLSWGLGLANFVFTFPTYLFIDKRGRRFLLLIGFPCMAISMLAAALAFNITGHTRNGAIAFFIFVFFFFYSWSGGPVPSAYSSEVFPLLNREAGMSFAVFCNLFGAGNGPSSNKICRVQNDNVYTKLQAS